MDINTLITVDPDILSGQPVFAGTRVPVESLFDHLEAGVPLDEFLDDFPTVTKAQAVALLALVSRQNLAQCVELAERHGLSALTMDEISAEVAENREAHDTLAAEITVAHEYCQVQP